MNARKTRALRVRRQVRIGKLKAVEAKLSAAINSHRLLEPLACDIDFMGPDWSPKLAEYKARHERLLQVFAGVAAERMQLTEKS